ncbi:MAG: DUF748 domain-containing protein [Betaproteobacteria bacterium]
MQIGRLASPRLRRIAVALLALYLLYVVLSLLLLPRALRWAVGTAAGEALGRTVQVETVTVNPLRLSARLDNLRIDAAAAGEPPLALVREIEVNISLASLWYRAPVLDALRIDGLTLNLARLDAQRFNFSDILDRLAARPKSDSGPARFALFNLEVADSRIDFDDRPRGQKHALEDIRLGLPFLSNLPADIEVTVQPAFAARLDGTALALTGETRPFANSLESVLHLKLDGLDVPRYLSAVPMKLNFELPSARLDTDLTVAFRQAHGDAPAAVAVSGTATLRDLKLAAPAGPAAAPLLQWQSLRVEIAAFAPLERRLEVASVQVQAPQAWVERDARGALNWSAFLARPVETSSAPGAQAAAPYAVKIDAVKLADGQLHFFDRSVGDLRIEARELNLTASALSTTDAAPGRVQLSGATSIGERFGIEGQLALAPLSARLDFNVDEARLRLFTRYIAQIADATLDGRSSVRGKLAFDRGAEGFELRLSEVGIEGRDIRVRGPDGAGAALDVRRLTVAGGRLDLAQRRIGADRVLLQAPRIAAKRLASGEIGWMRVLRAEPPAAVVAEERPAARQLPWSAEVQEFAVEQGRVEFEDEAVNPTARLGFEALSLKATGVRADGTQPVALQLRTRLAGGGSLAVDGRLRWDRPAGQLRIDLRAADITRLQAYLAQYLNAGLVSAQVSSRGELTLTDGPAPLAYRGTLRLTDLHLTDPTGGEDLLKWQSLDIDRVAVTLGSPLEVELGRIALTDFYARAIVSVQGKLNLADLIARRAPPAAEAGATEPSAPAPTLRIEGIEFARGNLNFTDNFIRPNYTANLTDIGGSIGRLATDSTEPARLALAGSVDGEAPVKIEGQLNPLAPKLFLDITGSTQGVDLPRFTPYSAHYAGYPILKGKLTMEVSYKIEDRKLNASNHLFIDQLTLGERSDSPNATSLPIPLAVALLKNARGEIDLRLPVTGSLDDPKFSIGGVVIQVIVNLLTKAVTAPFTLLAAAFGPGEELGYVQFAAGSADLDATQREKLDKLARALADRPGLKMDLIGRADPAVDNDGLRAAALQARLRAAKARQLARAGGASVPAAQVAIEPQERAALLTTVYGEEKIPDKPRNLIGIAKTLPAEEMEQRLLAYLAPTPEDLRALANRRAAAVRDDLQERGGIDRARLFLVEPKIGSDGLPAGTAGTRVDFALK